MAKLGYTRDIEHSEPIYARQDSLYPAASALLVQVELLLVLGGLSAMLVRHGVRFGRDRDLPSLSVTIIACMVGVVVCQCLRYYWSRRRTTFVRKERLSLIFSGVWVLGLLGFGAFYPLLVFGGGSIPEPLSAAALWTEVILTLDTAITIVASIRRVAGRGINPALVLVGSFLLLVAIGTVLLALPRSLEPDAAAHAGGHSRLQVALFTATSASCVTGLAVVPTADYFSRFGETVILILFQLGGLGIMTCGAFFALFAGRSFGVRERATFRDLLEGEQIGDVRRMLVTILLFTLACEAVGAVVISGLFAESALSERVFQSVFHAVSAFCNAGFSLTDNSFYGMAHRFEVWGGLCTLIIAGGLGFAVVYNLVIVGKKRFGRLAQPPLFHLHPSRTRLTLNTKIVLLTTAVLLVGGAFGYGVLESAGGATGNAPSGTVADAWFQSVTFRTAGFNSVDHGEMRPATKLFAIGLMFIGAAPGSTGGGIKTACFAVSVLALLSILRGRSRVEIFGRTIPEQSIYRALAVISLGLLVVLLTTMLLCIFENRPELFLDLLFEATSAFGTVGVSCGVTPGLSVPSQWLIIVVMFLGRVGPLTLMLAITPSSRSGLYTYPEERVLLG